MTEKAAVVVGVSDLRPDGRVMLLMAGAESDGPAEIALELEWRAALGLANSLREAAAFAAFKAGVSEKDVRAALRAALRNEAGRGDPNA